jgi:hypothetical protein
MADFRDDDERDDSTDSADEIAEDAYWDAKIEEWKCGDRPINGKYRGQR